MSLSIAYSLGHTRSTAVSPRMTCVSMVSLVSNVLYVMLRFLPVTSR